MKELLARIPQDGTVYIGEFVKAPYRSNTPSPSYRLHIRPRTASGRRVQAGNAQIILASGQALPVEIVGYAAHVHPRPEAIKSGQWTNRDQLISIRPTDLTEEQAQQARLIVQYASPE